jgi:hypothetical protein
VQEKYVQKQLVFPDPYDIVKRESAKGVAKMLTNDRGTIYSYLTMFDHICAGINQGALPALLPFLVLNHDFSYAMVVSRPFYKYLCITNEGILCQARRRSTALLAVMAYFSNAA